MTRPLPPALPILLAIAAWQLLLPLSSHAQVAVEVSRSPQLKRVTDQAVAAAGVTSVQFGETTLDWREHTPRGRARLIQALSGRQRQLSLLASDGVADPTTAAEDLSYASDLVQIDAADAAVWSFEFRNSGRNARRARWQLSRLPFDESVNHWRAPAGMVAHGEIMPLASGRTPTRFSIDFGQFLLGGQSSELSTPVAVALTSMLHGDFPSGTLYLRAVGLGRNGGPVSLPSPAVRIELAPLSKGNRMDPGALPSRIEVAGYSALRPLHSDARCWVRPTRSVTLAPGLPPGDDAAPADSGRQVAPHEAINLCTAANQDVLLAISSGYSSTAALAGEMRVWGARRLETAKEWVRNETQKRYGGVTAACAGPCRQALGLVLDQVIAVSGGAPASVSNPAPVTAASGYIERMLIHAFRLHSGMGEAFEGKAASEAAELFARMLRSTGDVPPPAFEPLHEKQERSPLLTLRVGAGEATSGHAWLQLRELGKRPRLHPVLVPVPPLEAGQQIELPIALSSTQTPDPDALMLPPSSILIDGLDSPSELLQRVSSQLEGLDKAIDKAYAPALKGRYRIELAWRDAQGGLRVIGVVTCEANRDRCSFKG